MLELRKKGNKHWLLIDEEIGEFTPSKFTINRLNNVINIVYFNNLKSKEYNVSDCYIFDIDDTSGFNTSNGVAFMDKLEELNCPCFQKNENIFNISGGAWGDITGNLSNQTDLQNALDSKLDKVTSSGVERAYIINADGSQSTKPTSEFGGALETDPIFLASEASNFVAGDKANLDNQSGINTGDETSSTIQTKRPLKTVNGESLEGSGNIQIDYNDLDNLPVIPTPITNHSGLSLDDGTNPHGTTKGDVGLSNVPNVDTSTTSNVSEGSNLYFTTARVLGTVLSGFIFNEIPSGAIDGINSIFNTNFLLVPDTEVVFINGQKQKKPDDYNISGQTITFTFSPGVSESLVINYIKQ